MLAVLEVKTISDKLTKLEAEALVDAVAETLTEVQAMILSD